MQRVKRTTAVVALPTAPTGGTPGYFANPNPGGGVPATVPGFEWFNSVQEELCAVIAAAGIALDVANPAQLLAALRAAGVFQTQATNDSSTKVATTAFANPSASLTTNGYQKLPSGLIVQWGIATNSSSADVNVTYPIAFPASLYSINITPQAATVGAFCAHNTQGLTSFNFSTWSAAATRATATPNHWIAIGK
jgi:hypothetical protein